MELASTGYGYPKWSGPPRYLEDSSNGDSGYLQVMDPSKLSTKMRFLVINCQRRPSIQAILPSLPENGEITVDTN